jgi:hypothetical protein
MYYFVSLLEYTEIEWGEVGCNRNLKRDEVRRINISELFVVQKEKLSIIVQD